MEYNNHQLENCLEQAISKFQVRDMLTEFGIPKDAEVTLKMQIGENSKPLVRCSVPNATQEKDISDGSMSLTNLQDLLIDKFVNPAISDLNLMEFIAGVGGVVDNDRNKLIFSFDSEGYNYSSRFTLAGGCCCRRSNGRCCKVCRNCTESCCPCKGN